jgi:hypothetical protein
MTNDQPQSTGEEELTPVEKAFAKFSDGRKALNHNYTKDQFDEFRFRGEWFYPATELLQFIDNVSK